MSLYKFCAHCNLCETCSEVSVLCSGWEKKKDELSQLAEGKLKELLTREDEKKPQDRIVKYLKQLILLSKTLILNKKNAVITEVERHLKTTDASKFDHVTQLLLWNYSDSTADNNFLRSLHKKLKNVKYIEMRNMDASRLGTISFENFEGLTTLSIYDITDRETLTDVHDKLKSLTYVIHDEDGTLLWKWESDRQNEMKMCIFTLFKPDMSTVEIIPKECSENATIVSLHNLTNIQDVTSSLDSLLEPFSKMSRLQIANSPVVTDSISLDVLTRITKTLDCVEIDVSSVNVDELSLTLRNLKVKELHIKNATNMSDDDVDKLRCSEEEVKVVIDKFTMPSLNDVLTHYDMDPSRAGICAIFNNEKFENPANNRPGSTVDADMLQETFEMFGYVVERHNNKTKDDMKISLDALSKKYEVNEENYCSVVICVLSHGGQGEIETFKNGETVKKVEDIYEKFNNKNCKGLQWKPRIFIFQSCRGDTLPQPVESVAVDYKNKDDKRKTSGTLPEMSDFLIAAPSAKDSVSFRNAKIGSPYIQTLCKYLREYGAEADMCQVLTAVQHKLHTQVYFKDGIKYTMMPEHTSALTKLLKFKKKEQ